MPSQDEYTAGEYEATDPFSAPVEPSVDYTNTTPADAYYYPGDYQNTAYTPADAYYYPGDYQNTAYTPADLASADPTTRSVLLSLPGSIGKAILDKYSPGGVTNWAAVGADALKAGAAIAAYNQANAPTPKTGYQGGIPSLVAARQQLTPATAGVRPGAGGQRYFTDTQYAAPAALPATQQAIAGQATGLNAQNLARQQAQVAQAPAAMTPEQQQASASKFFGRAPTPAPVQRAAQGGIMGLAHGGSTTEPGGTYLRGDTDGMADKLHATIDDNQPARLAHGEFVIPADVVSHLGNGNSDAGAKQLYSMMDKIRQARTGTKKQGKEINPDKFTPGGIAGYAAGGEVQHFADGGATGVASGVTGTESNLSNWAGPYVTGMLAKGEALSNQPYQAYQGPLTAGPSALQTQAFGNAANIETPASIGQAAASAGQAGAAMGNLSYTPTATTNQFTAPDKYATGTFTGGTFGAQQAQQYMNPYLQASLDPQLAEARRQAEITRVQQAGQMARAGAYGGGRQAIMESEGARNLGTNLANITGQGYNTAYSQAQNQFNTEQARQAAAQQATEQSRQFGATQGLTAAGQTAQYGQAAQQQAEQSKQFGAGYGLQALQGQLGAAQTQGQLGATQAQTGLAGLQAQLGAGAQERDITQQGVLADQAAFTAERENPYKMVQYQQSLLQGLPLAAQSYNITNNPYTAAAGAASTVNTALGGAAPLYNAQTGAKL